MWKVGMNDALIDSMMAETMAGAPELAVAELAIMGFIVGAKKISQHHKNKKETQRIEQQKQDDERRRQAEEQAQRQADEQARIIAEEEAKQRALEEEAKRQEEEARQHQIQVHNENQEVIQQSVNAEYGQVQNVEYEREHRIEMMMEENQDTDYQPYQPWRMPDNLPNGGGNDPDPNGGGGYDPNGDFIILDPAGQPIENQYQNPFWEMIGHATAQIAQQALMQKQEDEEEQKKIIEDLPKEPTEDQKIQIDEANQAHKDADQITDNQAIIQQQMLDVLTGLGEEELTLEQSLVELDKIEADLNKLLSSQVKTSSVYSSSIKTF